jgi:hypothetical protein
MPSRCRAQVAAIGNRRTREASRAANAEVHFYQSSKNTFLMECNTEFTVAQLFYDFDNPLMSTLDDIFVNIIESVKE